MNSVFLTSDPLPFCKGCGHTLIAENTGKALSKVQLSPLDVILVTDIGCHGIIDKCFNTHTVHGLHGRSVALAAGISAGLNDPEKKVIVFIGDGGVSIGMQHILDAAHNNYNMTVIVHNNMLYGMTGGQPSEFTPAGFKTPTLPDGADHPGYDVCKMVAAAGANYARRITGIGDYSDLLAEAFSKSGFSLVEVMEVCPSYAQKANPGMKLRKVIEEAGLQDKLYVDEQRSAFITKIRKETRSLIDFTKAIETSYSSELMQPFRILLSGSAGEGVQQAAELFARAAMKAGLHATKKGTYPVTVGVGFSTSEIILSPAPVLFTGLQVPDTAIITSKDGLDFSMGVLKTMNESNTLFVDSSLPVPEIKAKIIRMGFREKAGVKNSSLYAMAYLLQYEKIYPADAFFSAIGESKFGEKIDVNKWVLQ